MGKVCKAFVAAVLLVGFVVCLGLPAMAENVHELFFDLSKRHKRILAAESDMDAARNNVRVVLGAWFPEFDLTTHYGYEKQVKPNAIGTHMPTRELDLKLSQLLWDFGATNSSVQQARLTFEQARETLILTRQSLLLEAVTAYLGLINAKEILDFSLQSEANIKSQTEMENALVSRGSGFSTDVLQAKAQLAGANARRVQAEGALHVARNRYRAVFYADPPDAAALVKPRVPEELLPASIDEAVNMALKSNPQLIVAKFSFDVAKEAVTQTKAGQYFPTLNATVGRKWKKDVQGTAGFKGETLAQAELTYNFNLGMTASNAIGAARATLRAAQNRYTDTRELITEQARNAWSNIETARSNAFFLGNQANISAEFLELARKERKLGRRSLLDVLAGETELINSNSNAAAAKTSVDVAVYSLLLVMGELEADLFQADPSAQAPTVKRLLASPEIPLPRGQSDTASSSQKVREHSFPKTGQFFDIPVPVIPQQLPPQFESDQEPSPIPQVQRPQNPVPVVLVAPVQVAVPKAIAVPPAVSPPVVLVAPVQVAVPKATAVPPPVSSAVSPTGEYLVQLGSFRSEDDARKDWTRIRRQQKDLLATMTSSFQRADLGSKGVFFRLRAGPLASKSAAKNICAELTKRKVGCLVVRTSLTTGG